MDNFTYWAPTRYIFGTEAELRAGEQLEKEGISRVLIVYGGGSAVRSGLLDRVVASVGERGIETHLLGGVEPNPTDPKVREGIALCREKGIGGLLAVGGGSVIDTAKAIAAGAPYDGDFWDFWAGKATIERALPVGVVLTIPAAGSEGSGNSVITLLEGNHKISLRTDYWLRPRFALMDPKLTFTLPAYQTAAGIVDMMAHILERYFSPTEDVEVTDRVAEGVLTAIMEEAPKVMKNPADYQARANIMWCGTLAHNGVCGCGRREDWSSHGLEHELSALYGVTHGAGLAVVFPAYITYVADHKPAKAAQLARRVLGVSCVDDREAALRGAGRLKDFFRSLGMPVTLAELGVENPDIDLLVNKVLEDKGEPFGAYLPIDRTASEAIYRLML